MKGMTGSRTVVLDLDGVVRLWPGHDFEAELQARHRLPVTFITERLRAEGLEDQLLTGAITREQWRSEVKRRLGAQLGAEWLDRPTSIDERVVEVIRSHRFRGQRVVLLSNGTDELHQELADSSLLEQFDAVYNSAELGVRKPDEMIYRAVEDYELATPGQFVLVDDQARNVAGARRRGWQGIVYGGLPDLEAALKCARSPRRS